MADDATKRETLTSNKTSGLEERRTTDCFSKQPEDPSLFQLVASHPCLKAFFKQINFYAWEYDHATHCFSLLNAKSLVRNTALKLDLPPEALVSRGTIHPKSVSTYRIFTRKVLSGERFGGTAIRIRMSQSAGYLWYYVSFRTLFSADGQPVKAVGALARINPNNALPRFVEYYKLHEELISSLCVFARVNLSENLVDRLWLADKSLAGPTVEGISYSRLFSIYLPRLFTASAQRRFSDTLSLEALLATAKKKSPYWIVEASRIIEGSSYIRPVVLHVLLDRDEFSGHYYAFFYIQYVDHLYANAGEYYVRAKRLTESGIFNTDDAATLLKRFYEDDLHWRAYAVVRFCNRGVKLSRSQYNFIAGIFGLFFESIGFVTQLSERLLGIFLPNCESVAKVQNVLESAFLFVHKFLNGSAADSVYFTAAYTQGKLRQQFESEFIRNATVVCDRLGTKKFSDAIEYISSFTEISEIKNTRALFSDQSAESLPENNSENLTATETKLLIECLNGIITSSNSNVCLRQLLNIFGRYYAADRVYSVRLINDGQTLEQICEWGKTPRKLLKGLITGSSLSKFPLFERAFNSGKPVLINKVTRTESVISQRNLVHKTWSCILLPLSSSDSDFKGLLCVDNPMQNIGRITLLESLLSHLVNIHVRVLKERYDYISFGSVEPMMYRGFAAFHDKIETFSSESCASLGVCIAAVPKLLSLTNRFGIAHSKSVLHFLHEFLPAHCANASIFNTHENEYVIVIPNTTKEFFFERVAQIRRRCEERFPGQIALGATWAKGLFSGSSLVEEARSIMLSQKHTSASDFTVSTISQPIPDFADLPGRLTVFYQPKVDMTTKTVIGAEALVRGIDESGTIVPPGRFLAEVEKNGQMRTLDLFVFSRVLWQLSYWKSQGFKLLPVSINFSRYTFVADSTLGAILALLSSYDQVDPSFVEIEITETGYEVGASTLDRMMRPYLDQGLHFALDDFGSGYANLSIFSQVHFQTIKLDRSLIQNLNSNPISQSLVESIVNISRETNMSVLAEGVEDEMQAQILLQRGCCLAQGYLYGRPTDAHSFTNIYLVPHLARA